MIFSREEDMALIKRDIVTTISHHLADVDLLPTLYNSRLRNPTQKQISMREWNTELLYCLLSLSHLTEDFKGSLSRLAQRWRLGAEETESLRCVFFETLKNNYWHAIKTQLETMKRREKALIHDDKKAVLRFYRTLLVPKPFEKKNFGEVYTNFETIERLLDKIPARFWTDPRTRFLDPAAGMGSFLVCIYYRLMKTLAEAIPDGDERSQHIITKMIFAADINPVNTALIKKTFGGRIHVITIDSLRDPQKIGGGFHVVVMNPPFEHGQRCDTVKNGGNPMWPEFVHHTFEHWLQDGGYFAAVLPPGWRKPSNERSKSGDYTFLAYENSLRYVAMHDLHDGMRDFQCSIRYDLVVVEKTRPVINARYTCQVRDVTDVTRRIRIMDWAHFLPNTDFEKVAGLIGGTGGRLSILQTNKFHTGSHRDSTSKTRDATFHYPVVHSILKNDGTNLRWSSEKDRDVWRPKLVVNKQGQFHTPILDSRGMYGITENAVGIPIRTRAEGEKMRRWFVQNKAFIERAFMWGTSNPTFTPIVMGYFRTDFYE